MDQEPEIAIIIVELGDETEGARHQHTHPYVIHIYSEVDEADHAFRVKDSTLVGHVFAEFYKKTGLPTTDRDLFKCETTGEDVRPHQDETVAAFLAHGHCQPPVWIFTDKRKFRIVVNTKKELVETEHVSYAQIVAFAYPTSPAAPVGQQIAYTITYRHGPRVNPDGTLIENARLEVKDGMIFDVTVTFRS